jgi:uncharacterized membrane protein YhaH (DUF805 family)
LDYKNLLLSFEGRIGRQTYWMSYLAFIGIGVVLGIVSAFLGKAGAIIIVIFSLAIIWPALAIQAKRWHDRDKSAWWLLMNLVPAIGGIWVLVECGFLRGTEGQNSFGPDPLAGG